MDINTFTNADRKGEGDPPNIFTPLENNTNTAKQDFDQFFTEEVIKILEKNELKSTKTNVLRAFEKTILPNISTKHYNWIPIVLGAFLTPRSQTLFYRALRNSNVGDEMFNLQILLYECETYINIDDDNDIDDRRTVSNALLLCMNQNKHMNNVINGTLKVESGSRLDWCLAYKLYLSSLFTFTFEKKAMMHRSDRASDLRRKTRKNIYSAIEIFKGEIGYVHHMLVKAYLLMGDIILAYYSMPHMILKDISQNGMHLVQITEYRDAYVTAERIVEKMTKKRGYVDETVALSLLHISKIYYSLLSRPPGYSRTPILKFTDTDLKKPTKSQLWRYYSEISRYLEALIGESKHRMPTLCTSQILVHIGKRALVLNDDYRRALLCLQIALCIQYYYNSFNAEIVRTMFYIGYVYLEMKDYHKSRAIVNKLTRLNVIYPHVKSPYLGMLALQNDIIKASMKTDKTTEPTTRFDFDALIREQTDKLARYGLNPYLKELGISWLQCKKDLHDDETFLQRHMVACDNCKRCPRSTYDDGKSKVSIRFVGK